MPPSETRRLWSAAGSAEARLVFPEAFLESLRSALDAGMSCEQITSCIYMVTAVVRMGDRFCPDELVPRVKSLAEVIGGDIHCRRAGR